MDIGGPSQVDPNMLISQQARQNRIGTVTPYGTTQYYEDRGGPRNDTRMEMTLSPAQQAILNAQQNAQLMGLQQAQSRFGELGAGRDAVEAAHFKRAMGLLGPEFERSERALQQRLANQGLSQRGGAYDREVGRFETGRNQAMERMANEAVLAGGQEESRMLQAILGLLGQGQVTLPEGFAPGPVDVMAPYALRSQAQAADQQFWGQIIGGGLGAAGLGAAAAMGSSRTTKFDLGEAPAVLEQVASLDLRRWRYREGPDQAEHIGAMAEDWRDQLGLGDGATISVIDAFGVALRAVQELTARVAQLEGRS